jgi:hypothetical protein
MKTLYAYQFIVIVFFAQSLSAHRKFDQLAEYERQKEALFYHVRSSNYEKFEPALNSFMSLELKSEPHPNEKSENRELESSNPNQESTLPNAHMETLDQQKLNVLKKIKDDNKAFMNFYTIKLYRWPYNAASKIWNGICYLSAACGILIFSHTTYTGSIEDIKADDIIQTQNFIFNCLGIKNSVPIPLTASKNVGMFLFGLSMIPALYGTKQLYDAASLKKALEKKKENAKNISDLLKKKSQSNKESLGTSKKR